MISFFKAHNTKYLLLFSAFSCVLLAIRFYVEVDGANFLFLTINLFLAWIPYLISQVFRKENLSKTILYLSVFMWLLFFPNALYVVTDLFQLWPRPKGGIWFDLIMLFSFAFTSLLLGFGSLQNLEKYFSRRIKNRFKLNLISFLFIYLGSFGVYFGRFRRWNSWDILHKPWFYKREGVYFFENPIEDIDFYGTTLLFAILVYLLYYGIYNFAKNQQ